MMSFNQLNNGSPKTEDNKNKITPFKLSLEEKNSLYFKILIDFKDYNNPDPPEKQDDYLALPSTEVMGRLKTLGLLENIIEFQEKMDNGLVYDDPLRKGAKFEIIARFTLMEIEDMQKSK